MTDEQAEIFVSAVETINKNAMSLADLVFKQGREIRKLSNRISDLERRINEEYKSASGRKRPDIG